MRVKCPAPEHNTITRLGLEPRPLDPESSVLTTRPLGIFGLENYLLIFKCRQVYQNENLAETIFVMIFHTDKQNLPS